MLKNYVTLAIIFLSSTGSMWAQSAPADAPAKLISAPPFEISAEDQAAGIDGTMKIAVFVDYTGEPKKAVAYVGPNWPCARDLETRVNAVMRAAEKAAMDFKFAPAIQNGMPIDSQLGVAMKIGWSAQKKDDPKPVPDPGSLNGSDTPTQPDLVDSGVVNGKATSLPEPRYPYDAKVARLSGIVTVRVVIDERGKVIYAQAVDGPTMLQFAARRAACKAKFSPTLLKGSPVKVSGKITYNFVP